MSLKDYASRKIRESEEFFSPGDNSRPNNLVGKYLLPKMSVLDIWCWPATFYRRWEDRDIKYYGVDYNDWFVNYGISKGLNIQKCDLFTENIPFEDGKFDFIYCRHVIEHLPTNIQIKLFAEISRLLKKDWIVVLLWPTPYHWYFRDDETHYRPITHGQLAHLADNFELRVIESKYSLTHIFPNSWQRWLRLPPLRFFLRETYLVAQKK